PRLPRQALPRLATHRPCGEGRRRGPAGPRRDRRPRTGPPQRARSHSRREHLRMSEPRGAHGGRNAIVEELARVHADFHHLAATTTPDELHRRSNGTRWSNRQLLFHMVFGYVLVRTLLPL